MERPYNITRILNSFKSFIKQAYQKGYAQKLKHEKG